jgi:DNA primase
MSDDSARINATLTDAHALCDALGLLVGRRGHDWMRCARGVTVRCPWHDESTPSCLISNAGNGFGIMAHCFGCGRSGNVFDVIAVANALDKRAAFPDVLDIAADLAGVSRPERHRRASRPSERPIIQRTAVVEVAPTPDDGTIDRIAALLSQIAPVTESVAAMAYLRARGLDRSEAVGWYALPEGPARDEVVAVVVEEVGWDAWMSSGLATLTGQHRGRWAWAWRGPRLVIPWRAQDRTVQALQGRYMGDVPPEVKRYVFPSGHAPQWPYGVDALASHPDAAVAVCEGAIDAASLNVLAQDHGVDLVALALSSVSAWHARWFRCFSGRRCVVALDRDEAGTSKTAEMVERLRAVARRGEVRVLAPSRGKDWNDALRAALGGSVT